MGWWKTAKAGDKVVCVNDAENLVTPPKGWLFIPGLNGLTKGKVYTVRDIGIDPGDGNPVVFLSEIIRPISGDCHCEIGFAVQRFRPVQKKSTDTGMAILKRILEQPEIKIVEEA